MIDLRFPPESNLNYNFLPFREISTLANEIVRLCTILPTDYV